MIVTLMRLTILYPSFLVVLWLTVSEYYSVRRELPCYLLFVQMSNLSNLSILRSGLRFKAEMPLPQCYHYSATILLPRTFVGRLCCRSLSAYSCGLYCSLLCFVAGTSCSLHVLWGVSLKGYTYEICWYCIGALFLQTFCLRGRSHFIIDNNT